MPGLSFYEKQHIQRLIDQEGSLKLIFDVFSRRTSQLLTKWSDSGNSNVWARNGGIEKEIEKELTDLHSRLLKNINDFSIDGWERSNLKTDDLISAFIKDMPLSKTIRDGLYPRNLEALSAFQKRKIDNLTISDRVWKVTGTAKENIEYYLQSGLATGRSASLISQDVRQLLKNPDKRFHRIRNEEGKLMPSAPMKAYHPGQGVYRSSFMNAKRLAATETNMAYRAADCERWKNLDFVLGIEVKRSNSAKGPCPVCDPLVGKYPKDFKYWGWHPFCICVATPILMDEDKFIDYLGDGNIQPGDFVKDIPSDARDYMESKIKEGKVTFDSYLFKDNKKYFEVFALMEKAKAAAPAVETIANKIANKYEGYISPIDLKSQESIKRKVRDELEGDVSKVKDSVRNTIVIEESKMNDVYNAMNSDDSFIRVDWVKSDSNSLGYSGIIGNFRASNGIIAEIQVNTEKMIYAKHDKKSAVSIIGGKRWNEIYKEIGIEGGLGHRYYEEWRSLGKTKPSEILRKSELEKLSTEYYNKFLK